MVEVSVVICSEDSCVMSVAASDLPGVVGRTDKAPLRFVTAASLFDGHDAAIVGDPWRAGAGQLGLVTIVELHELERPAPDPPGCVRTLEYQLDRVDRRLAVLTARPRDRSPEGDADRVALGDSVTVAGKTKRDDQSGYRGDGISDMRALHDRET